jgi:hypothetical protein
MDGLLFIGAVLLIWLFLHKGSQSSGTVPVSPTPQPNYDSDAGNALETIKQAIFHKEGGRPGDRNVVNNNPGNLRSGPGMTGTAGGFATFASQDDGYSALEAWITKHTAAHPDWNFYDLFNYYLRGSTTAPANDKEGNSDAYAEYVANYIGVDPAEPVSSVVGG